MLKFERRGWWQNDDWGHEDLFLFMRRHNVCQKQDKELTLGLRWKWWRLMGVRKWQFGAIFLPQQELPPWRERSVVIKWWFVLWTVHWGVRSMGMHVQAIGGTWAFIPELRWALVFTGFTEVMAANFQGFPCVCRFSLLPCLSKRKL